jgi:recombination protein RecA
MYGEGISMEGGLLDVGVAGDIVSKTGAWFNFGDVRLGQGREQSKDFLKANPAVAAEIDAKIRSATATLDVPVAPPGDGE